MPSRKFRLHKLVRDGVFESMESLGQSPEHRVLSGEELIQASDDKLREEAGELGKGNPVEEIADILEATMQAARARGIHNIEVLTVQSAKYDKVGDFSRGIFVETVITPEGDPWGDYYASDPDRFEELPMDDAQ